MILATSNEWHLRVLLIRDGDLSVAQCVELDIGAQASTLAEVQASFAQTFVGQALVDSMAGKQPFADVRRAPDWYAEKFDAAMGGKSVHRLNLALPADLLPGRALPTIRVVAEVRVPA